MSLDRARQSIARLRDLTSGKLRVPAAPLTLDVNSRVSSSSRSSSHGSSTSSRTNCAPATRASQAPSARRATKQTRRSAASPARPTRRRSTTARRPSSWSAPAPRPRSTRSATSALARGERRRPDLGRSSQGVRIWCRSAFHRRPRRSRRTYRRRWVSRWRWCRRAASGARMRLRRCSGGVLVRRRVPQPLDRAGCLERRVVDRIPARASAGALRVRGQRARDLGAHPDGLGRGEDARDAQRALHPGGRERPGCRVRGREHGDRARAPEPCARVPPPAHRAAVGTRGLGPLHRIPQRCGDRGRPGARSGARLGGRLSTPACSMARRSRRSSTRRASGSAPPLRRGRHSAQAHHARRGDAAARAEPS